MRSRTLAAGAVALTATLAACGGAGGSSGGAASSSNKPSKGPVTLTWWDYFGYSKQGNAAIDGLIKAYEKAHPNVTIKRTSYAYPDMWTKLNQTIATNTTPDIIAMDAGQIPTYAAQGALVDLSKWTSNWPVWKQFYPQVAQEVTLDGKTYGVPFRSNSIVLWMNQDELKAAGVKHAPRSWDELRAAAKQATDGQHSGICFPATKDTTGMFPLLAFLWGAGSDLNSLGDAGSVKALGFLNTLVNQDHSAPKSVLQWEWDDVAAQFTNGKCAMMINGPWEYPAVSASKFKWSVATMPAGTAGDAAPLGGEAWAIGKSSKHPGDVWQLIQWLADNSHSFRPIMAGLQSFPVRKDQEGLPGGNWSPIVPVVSQQVKVARSLARYGKQYGQVATAAETMEQEVLTGAKPPQQAADEAKATIQPLLG